MEECKNDYCQFKQNCKFEDCPFRNSQKPDAQELVMFLIKKSFEKKPESEE